MFTGIVEEIGTIKNIRRGTHSISLEIEAHTVLEDTKVGDSISTNGVCLTVTDMSSNTFSADVMPQTMRMTSFSTLKAGDKVNLERALTLQTRLGGHMVSGHIDGVGKVTRREQDDTAIWVWIETTPAIMRYIIAQGSITVQGVSLTVAKVQNNAFSISLIPHTQGATTLHSIKAGDIVNLENDIVAKYVEKFTLEGNLDKKTPSDDSKDALYRDFMLRA
ncbi:MAG: riboflavin synthase [Prevotella sp.]|nr:riboflavin synthase [Prevotella sp.]